MPRSRSRSRGRRSRSRDRRSRSRGRRSPPRGGGRKSRGHSPSRMGGSRRSHSRDRAGPKDSPPHKRSGSKSRDRGRQPPPSQQRGRDLRERIKRSPSRNRLGASRSPERARPRLSSPGREGGQGPRGGWGSMGRGGRGGRFSPGGRRSPPIRRRSPEGDRRPPGDRRPSGPGNRRPSGLGDRRPGGSTTQRSQSRDRNRARSHSPHNRDKKVPKGPNPYMQQKELGYTGRSLNERFATKYDPLDFTPEDNISVGIERNIRGNEPAKVDIPLKPKDVIVPRRRDEGQIPFCEREEFEEREAEEEVEEKRTIRVVQSDNPNKRLIDRLDRQYAQKRDNFEVRSDRFSHMGSGGGRLGNPNDLRHNLQRRRSGREEEKPREDRRKIDAGRLSGRLGGRGGGEIGSQELPDFSNRPDKYNLDWIEHPEMIPRGDSYYEHDRRDDPNYNARGERRIRGSRGGGRWMRGGFFRGRGRGFRSGADWDRTWKHDKFKEVNEDDSPSAKDKKGSKKDSRKDSSSIKKDIEEEKKESSSIKESEEPTSTT